MFNTCTTSSQQNFKAKEFQFVGKEIKKRFISAKTN